MIALASLTETTTGIVEKFGVDWPLLIAQGFNFLLVAFVIWQFALKKVLSTIKEREEKIADSLKNAEKIKLELEATEKQQQETLQEASLEAKKTVAVAHEKAKSYIESQRTDGSKKGRKASTSSWRLQQRLWHRR